MKPRNYKDLPKFPAPKKTVRSVKCWLLLDKEGNKGGGVFTGTNQQVRAYKTKEDMKNDGWSLESESWPVCSATVTFTLPPNKGKKGGKK